jgi:hypothetical protein
MSCSCSWDITLRALFRQVWAPVGTDCIRPCSLETTQHFAVYHLYLRNYGEKQGRTQQKKMPSRAQLGSEITERAAYSQQAWQCWRQGLLLLPIAETAQEPQLNMRRDIINELLTISILCKFKKWAYILGATKFWCIFMHMLTCVFIFSSCDNDSQLTANSSPWSHLTHLTKLTLVPLPWTSENSSKLLSAPHTSQHLSSNSLYIHLEAVFSETITYSLGIQKCSIMRPLHEHCRDGLVPHIPVTCVTEITKDQTVYHEQLQGNFILYTSTHHPCLRFCKNIRGLTHRALRAEQIHKDREKAWRHPQRRNHNAHPGWLHMPAQMHSLWMNLQYLLHNWGLQYNTHHIIQMVPPIITAITSSEKSDLKVE